MSPRFSITVNGKVRVPFFHGEGRKREILWMEHQPISRKGGTRTRDTLIYRRDDCLGRVRTRWVDGIESQATEKHNSEIRAGSHIDWLAERD